MKTTIKECLMVVSTAPAKIWLDLGFDPSEEGGPMTVLSRDNIEAAITEVTRVLS